MLAIFTNKTLNYKVHTGSWDDSTRNHTLIYKVYDIYLFLFNPNESEKHTFSKNSKIYLHIKVTLRVLR